MFWQKIWDVIVKVALAIYEVNKKYGLTPYSFFTKQLQPYYSPTKIPALDTALFLVASFSVTIISFLFLGRFIKGFWIKTIASIFMFLLLLHLFSQTMFWILFGVLFVFLIAYIVLKIKARREEIKKYGKAGNPNKKKKELVLYDPHDVDNEDYKSVSTKRNQPVFKNEEGNVKESDNNTALNNNILDNEKKPISEVVDYKKINGSKKTSKHSVNLVSNELFLSKYRRLSEDNISSVSENKIIVDSDLSDLPKKQKPKLFQRIKKSKPKQDLTKKDYDYIDKDKYLESLGLLQEEFENFNVTLKTTSANKVAKPDKQKQNILSENQSQRLLKTYSKKSKKSKK